MMCFMVCRGCHAEFLFSSLATLGDIKRIIEEHGCLPALVRWDGTIRKAVGKLIVFQSIRNGSDIEQLPIEVNGIEVGPFKVFRWGPESYQLWHIQHKSKSGLPWAFKRRRDAVEMCKRILDKHAAEYNASDEDFHPSKGDPVGEEMYRIAREAAQALGGIR